MIDAVTPNNPVWVSRLDHHMSLANGIALRAAGVTRDTPDVDGVSTYTGFGYLEVASAEPETVVEVLRFAEKPDRETAARYHINSVVLLNNNFSLNQDERPFSAAYGGKQEEGFEMWQFSRETDFAKLAASLGCVGMVVEKADDLKPAIERAMSLDKPVVVDVRTDIKAMAPRAWTAPTEAPLRPGTTY